MRWSLYTNVFQPYINLNADIDNSMINTFYINLY
jgi:hypothetical protein